MELNGSIISSSWFWYLFHWLSPILSYCMCYCINIVPLCYKVSTQVCICNEIHFQDIIWWSIDLSTNHFNRQPFSSNLFSSHTLTYACILQFKLSSMVVYLISQSYLNILQSNLYCYLPYVSSIYKLKNYYISLLQNTLYTAE